VAEAARVAAVTTIMTGATTKATIVVRLMLTVKTNNHRQWRLKLRDGYE